MVRLLLLWLFVSFVAVYSWNDWYKALCALILMVAVVEHPDMPKTIWGIQGLNPWNLLLFVIFMAWLANRQKEGLKWDMPPTINRLLVLYLVVILIGFVRMEADYDGMIEYSALFNWDPPTRLGMLSEHLINCVKWVVPGMLLFDGCRDEKRFRLGLYALLGVYFLLSVQVIRWMPLSAAVSGDSLTARSLKILVNEVGFHRVNMSMLLAGASWALFSTSILYDSRMHKWLVLCGCAVIVFGQALTGGRTGYGTWLVIGLVMCSIRWRKLMIIVPFFIVAVLSFVPGVMERLSQGFDPNSTDMNPHIEDTVHFGNQQGPNLYTVTAGRNVAWPFVIEKILERPFIGYGREAMQRSGLATFLWQELGESFPHPHNAYLQIFLDAGLIGAFPILLFYWLILRKSLSLFRDGSRPQYVAIGGACAALVMALLIASVGSQTFYPREGAVGMWCAIGLMLRVHLLREANKGRRKDGGLSVGEISLWEDGKKI